MKKQKKRQKNKFLDGSKNTHIEIASNMQGIAQKYNFLLARLKAFITDMFLLNMPILYITTYIFLQGKEDFLHNQLAIFFCEIFYCFLLFLFFVFKGQTPGFRYAEIMLCKDTDNVDKIPPNAWQVFVFIIIWLIELCFFLWIFSFMRKDKKTLHEILSRTHIIYKANPARKAYEEGKRIYKQYK